VPLSPEQQKFLTHLGGNVRSRRMKANLTQARLAENAELDLRTIQKIEAGELNLLVTTVARLKEALKCRWEDLLGR
jgi:transcriptional regulator with XRE-family HTH domain